MKAVLVEKLTEFMTAAFALVAALAWNTAIQQIFKSIFGEQSSIPAMLGYAILVTVIAVVAITSMNKTAEKAKAHLAKKQNA